MNGCRTSRNLIELSITGLILLIGLANCSDPEVKFRPGLGDTLPLAPELNILVVSFDALRADALGVYGYHRDTSPNLDRFAAESTVFEHAYTAAPVTPTSFASAFTGLYPYRAFVGWKMLPVTTLAGAMQESGRHTFGIFNNIQLAKERNFDQGFDHFDVDLPSDRAVLASAREQLSQNRNRPFFGWVHFISPHTPYDYREMSAHLAPLESEGRYARSVPPNQEIQSPEELARVRDLYDGEIFFADHLFGRLMKIMKNLGLMKNTVIIVTADHGESFMEKGTLGHKSVDEGVIRIPMMIRHPSRLAGNRSEIPYINADLLPTLTAMAGLPVAGGLDGLDLAKPIPENRSRIISLITNAEKHRIAIVSSDNKLIINCVPQYSEELYDLATDPGETLNLILDRPELAARLANEMGDIARDDPCALIRNSNAGEAPENLLTPDQIRQLKSLGYIQ